MSLAWFMLLPTACVTAGKVGPQGYSHEKFGYTIPYAQANEKIFITPAWKLETNAEGQPSVKGSGTFRVDVKSFKGHEDHIVVQDVDLVFKHRETNGVISVQSAPLADTISDKKLPILAKDFVERLSGLYYVSLSQGSTRVGMGKNLVTNMIDSKSATLGSAETYEVVVDVANADQLKLNPEHRLMRYKMVLIRPKAPDGWKEMRGVYGKKVKAEDARVEETYPAIIVLTYAMDNAFYQDYLADFDSFIHRVKLRN
jgi:hypothetical protein